jgi:3-oxoadipate enol-lactonase
MSVIEVPGARLYVEQAGAGLPLLAVSGSGSALSDGMGPATMPFTEHFEVVGWDHRGLGLSTCADEPLTMAVFAADALALADSLGWDEFALFGVSFGGMVAQEIACTAGDRITRMVLACTSSGGAGGSSYPLHERPSEDALAGLIDTRPEVSEAIRSLMGGRMAPAEPGYTRQLEARASHDVWDRLPSVEVPTLVASGAYDGIAPPANGQAIADRIPGAQHQLFEGGHAFLWQDAAAWPAITGFLRS